MGERMKLGLDEIEKALGVVDTTRIALKENRDGVYTGSKTIIFLQGKGEIFGPRQLGYPSVSKDSMEFYAELFANAPEWLRLLVEQNKDLLARNEELQREQEKMQAVVEAARELVEVASLRGDNELPHPSDDPKLWSGRMQDAWIDIEHSLSALDAKEQDDD